MSVFDLRSICVLQQGGGNCNLIIDAADLKSLNRQLTEQSSYHSLPIPKEYLAIDDYIFGPLIENQRYIEVTKASDLSEIPFIQRSGGESRALTVKVKNKVVTLIIPSWLTKVCLKPEEIRQRTDAQIKK